MVVKRVVFLIFAVLPAATTHGQSVPGRPVAACACGRSAESSSRKPRWLLPIAGGLGFLPVAMSRGAPGPVGAPDLADIRDLPGGGPQNALAGERQLAMGALAPDTATSLPTLMVLALLLLALGALFMRPRPGRRAWAFWRKPTERPRGGWRLRTIHRRRIGGAIASLGGLLLVLGGREYAEGAETQREARAEWLRMASAPTALSGGASASGVEAPDGAPGGAPRPATRVPNVRLASAVPLPAVAMSAKEIRRGAVVARLVIPAINLDEIVMEGVGPVELNGGPGHFPGSVLPGEAGNAILSAHRDRHFRRLGELGIGSHIRTQTRNHTVEWVITERRIVSRDMPALFEEPEATLTLTTCWPIRYFGSAPDRLLLVAKPVKPVS